MSDYKLTGAITGEQDQLLLDYFTEYQASALQAKQLASAKAVGAAYPRVTAPLQAATSPRTITLTFDTPQPIAGANAPILSGGGSTGGMSTITTVSNTPNGGRNILTFDIDGNKADGFPQTLQYSMSARQSIKPTAVGFHVEEFGFSPGRVNIDAIVIFRGTAPFQIQRFFEFFKRQKMTQTLDPSQPGAIVRLFDSYLSRSYIITQESLQFTESATQQNVGRLVIAASILQDYSNPVTVKTASGTLDGLLSGQAAASADLSSLTAFVNGAGEATNVG